MELIIEDIRSFVGKHTIPIKPLTLLTGENSSGKSTLLASLAVVSDPYSFPLNPRFNDPPYSLGNYDTIATFKGGRYSRAKSFSVGYKQAGKKSGEQVAHYVSNQGLLELSSVVAKQDNNEAVLKFFSKESEPCIEIRAVHEGEPYGPTTVPYDPIARLNRLGSLIYFGLFSLLQKENKQRNAKDTKIIRQLLSMFDQDVQKALSIAPIRIKPRRTYDEITEDFSPEGEHIPFVLSNLLDQESTRATVERFGVESGLYTKLDVKRLGKQLSDPTQVMVTGSSRAVNLIDVGYGVSQVLPVIVQSILATPQTLLLVQQPEVHLHPRAQAALGSLFADLVVKGGKQFVVETHSDYIIDRVRMEVAKGTIRAEDVGILYLEKCGFETSVHQLELSENGDILNAPPSYRAFFLQEELNLFNRAER